MIAIANGPARTVASGRDAADPIAELPIPEEVRRQGDEAVRRYQDKQRLAYQSFAPVNWCSALGTVLANEEVIDGKSERGGHPVTRLALRQWMLRITEYADRLMDELAELDWSESIKTLQRNWIGRSEGAEVDFFIGKPGTGRRRAGVRRVETSAELERLSRKSRRTTCCGFTRRGPIRCLAQLTWCSRPSIRLSIA